MALAKREELALNCRPRFDWFRAFLRLCLRNASIEPSALRLHFRREADTASLHLELLGSEPCYRLDRLGQLLRLSFSRNVSTCEFSAGRLVQTSRWLHVDPLGTNTRIVCVDDLAFDRALVDGSRRGWQSWSTERGATADTEVRPQRALFEDDEDSAWRILAQRLGSCGLT
jgi:hypothetical protein